MKRHFFFALIISLSFLTCTDEPGEIRLSFNYQPGEIYAYEMTDDVEYQTTSCSGEITNVSRRQKQITKIQVVEKDSVESLYKLLVSFSLVSDTIMYPEDYTGEKKKASKERLGRIDEYTLSMRENGEIVEVSGKNKHATEYYERAYKTRQPVFPQQKIAPGYKWKQTIYLNIPDTEPIPVTLKYKFGGYEKIGGYKCAIIKYFSTFTKKRDLTPTKWNKDGYKQWLATYVTRSHGELYLAVSEGIFVKKSAKITTNTDYDIIEKDGTHSSFERKTADIENVRLISVAKDTSHFTILKNF